MKKVILSLTLIVLLGLFCGCSDFKKDDKGRPIAPIPFEKEGITYVMNPDRGGYTVVSVDKQLDEVTIPLVINLFPVSIIGKNSFKGSKASVITLPNSIRTIEDGAFAQCVNLKEFTVSKLVTAFGVGVFENSTALKKVVFEDGMILNRVQNNTFSGCIGLTEVQFPANFTSIGEKAFANCTSLEVVSPMLNLVRMDKESFLNCTKLKSFYINQELRTISLRAFYNCTALTLQCEWEADGAWGNIEEEFGGPVIMNWVEDWNLLLSKTEADETITKTYVPIVWNVAR